MDRVTDAYERLDTLLENRRYLVGDRFSWADLTLAALAAPRSSLRVAEFFCRKTGSPLFREMLCGTSDAQCAD